MLLIITRYFHHVTPRQQCQTTKEVCAHHERGGERKSSHVTTKKKLHVLRRVRKVKSELRTLRISRGKIFNSRKNEKETRGKAKSTRLRTRVH